MAFGLTLEGFVAKTLEDIRDALEAALKDKFGTSLPLGDETIFGELVGILAERLAELWEVAEASHANQDPDSATGAGLESLCAITGTFRQEATYSTVAQLVLAGTAATLVPGGSQASVDGTGDLFATDADATIAAASAWASATPYAVGAFATNDGGKLYVCTQAGTSAGSGGPTGTGTAIVDNTCVWYYVSTDAGAVLVAATAVETGPIVAATGDLNTIETPVSGWNTVVNFTGALEGSDEETDEELRVRRELELAKAGTSIIDAIRAELLGVTGVTSATVFHNPTNATDSDGVPPHYVDAVVEGGADDDIAAALLASVAAGIGTHSNSGDSGVALDSQGISHTKYFTRPTSTRIYVAVTLTYDAALYPEDGDTQIKEAVEAWGDAQKVGKDVVSSAIKAACFNVAGVLDVSLAKISTSPSPTVETTIAIGTRERMSIDAADIGVTSSPATP